MTTKKLRTSEVVFTGKIVAVYTEEQVAELQAELERVTKEREHFRSKRADDVIAAALLIQSANAERDEARAEVAALKTVVAALIDAMPEDLLKVGLTDPDQWRPFARGWARDIQEETREACAKVAEAGASVPVREWSRGTAVSIAAAIRARVLP